jgi:hypothetical protein
MKTIEQLKAELAELETASEPTAKTPQPNQSVTADDPLDFIAHPITADERKSFANSQTGRFDENKTLEQFTQTIRQIKVWSNNILQSEIGTAAS